MGNRLSGSPDAHRIRFVKCQSYDTSSQDIGVHFSFFLPA